MTQQYTEFCCRSGGSNLNAGTLNGDSTEPGTSASFTYTSGTWVNATGVFTLASGNPQTDGVAVGNWASVYADGASAPTGFIGRVTARNATTITVSVSAGTGCCGTVPTDGTSNRTIKIGGAWAGPSGTSGFPLNFGTGAGNIQQKQFLNDTTGRKPRINFKNDQTYPITSTLTIPQNSDKYCTFQCYTTSYGDFGKAIVDGGATGTNYTVVSFTNPNLTVMRDFIVQNNGDTGLAHHLDLVFGAGGTMDMVRCVGRHAWGRGFAEFRLAVECEAYDHLRAGLVTTESVGGGGLDRVSVYRGVVHDSGVANIPGAGATPYHETPGMFNCIASNATGFGSDLGLCVNNDVYRCGANLQPGISMPSGSVALNNNVTNCTTSGFALESPAAEAVTNRYGTGTAANAANSDGSAYYTDLSGYTANDRPWADTATGDFRLVLEAARNSGRGSFTQVASTYAGTVGYPDMGAADFPSIGILVTPSMTGGMG